MSSKSSVKQNPYENQKAKTVEQGLREEEDSNVDKGLRDKEPATGETKEDEQSLLEQVHEALPLAGFDFKHLKVLQNIPISSFYGVDFTNLDRPIRPLSNVGSFYGLDTESLAAENAALDDFYAKRKSEKTSCGKDQTSGNMCSQYQNRDILFPTSASEEDDDIRTLKIFWEYKVFYGPIPDVLARPATRFGPHHPLLVYVDCKIQKAECISGSRLTEKILKLQTKYKKLVAEKGETPEDQEFSTPDDYSFFQLSRMIWERDEEFDVLREVDVHCDENVELEAVEIGKLVINDQE